MTAVLEENVAEVETTIVPTPEDNRQEVEVRAYLRYLDRGCVDGWDLDDWFAAEAELRPERDRVPVKP